MEETLTRVAEMVRRRTPCFVVTANLDFATQAARDVELQRIFVEAELVVCDGTPLVWASRLTGKPLRERVAGSDLVPRLAAMGAAPGWKLFLLGGDAGSLAAAIANLETAYPGLRVSGYSPPFKRFHEMDHGDILRRIQEAAPDVLLVAFGCPKQEKWIYAHYRTAGVPVSIGVGATVDFLAGKVRRAPGWLGKLGLEWVYRLAQEPRRLLGRYAGNLTFLASQMWRERSAIFRPPGIAAPGAVCHSQADDDFQTLFWKGQLVAATLAQLEPPSLAKPFVIDLSNVTVIDSSGLGHLLGTLRRGWAAGQAGCFCAPSDPVLHILAVTRLDRVVPVAVGMAGARELLAQERVHWYLRPIVDSVEGSIYFVMPRKLVGANAGTCGDAVTREWETRPDLRKLFLDLGATDFMDSSGLGLLIRCRRLIESRSGASLELLHLQPNVRNVIQVARMDTLLGVNTP